MLDWLKKNSKYVSLFILGVALIVVYKTFDNLKNIFSVFGIIIEAVKPFVIAFVIAYLLNIPSRKLGSVIKNRAKNKWLRNHSHGISIAVSYTLFLLLVMVVIGSIVPAIYKNIMEMYSNLPIFIDTVLHTIMKLPGIEKLELNLTTVDVLSKIYSSFDITALGKYASGFMSFTSQLLDIVIALIASIYALLDKERILKSIHRLVDLFWTRSQSNAFFAGSSRVNIIFTKYLYSRLICCVVMAVVCSVVLGIMGEPYALILGIFIGFMDLIPYFGSIISWVVCAIFMAVSGGIFHSVWCSAAMLVLQTLDGNVLAPKVTGDQLEIRPLLVIISVSVGGTLFGFLGMVVSVPIIAVLRAIIGEYLAAREHMLKNADNKEKNTIKEDE